MGNPPVFIECQVGEISADTNIQKYLAFTGSEMVLSRLSLRTEDENPLLVVEAACPYGLVRFELLEMLIQEVAAIGADLIDLAEGRINRIRRMTKRAAERSTTRRSLWLRPLKRPRGPCCTTTASPRKLRLRS